MPANTFSLEANIVDLHRSRIFYGALQVSEGRIVQIHELPSGSDDEAARAGASYILPGFVDAHVHIESSMLIPSEFARLAVVHGTVATVSDPHEIANVCGMAGVDFMLENSKTVPFKFNFGAPSCVPATIFETAGDALDAADVAALLQKEDIRYLSEMMNFPGVLAGDSEVMAKIAAARAAGKPVDGHAPGLRGSDAQRYIDAGISTDHECFTRDEALDKLQRGMKVLIREGSAARNFDALIDLLHSWPDHIMFCSDDKHPDSLLEGHINQLCARAVARGIDLFNVLKAACYNPVKHYRLPVGLLSPGDPADFVLVSDLKKFEVLATYVDGQKVAENGVSLIVPPMNPMVINRFNAEKQPPEAFRVTYRGQQQIPVIGALDGQLITEKIMAAPLIGEDGFVQSDITRDILKIAVVNRYHKAPVAVAFISNFGLKQGAIASTVAHDSHNIVAVGVDDNALCRAVNLLVDARGGVSATDGYTDHLLPLPVAGLMSAVNGYEVAAGYIAIDRFVKETLGATLASPFMTLSFMALLVIPHLKLSDKGLFDGDSFSFVA